MAGERLLEMEAKNARESAYMMPATTAPSQQLHKAWPKTHSRLLL
ncbi:hypothetical protein BRO54_2951 [Geobacillus proteiniphilus]|uniref:Uncharacterized protein n=1 Tax=Geobacillus proteiniphilus TaxID=860353 RepID=A0A1Q5SSG5_9BACL|nr:hypothetical protein BRO54_2951 [Geobacillus proteiniphilus]